MVVSQPHPVCNELFSREGGDTEVQALLRNTEQDCALSVARDQGMADRLRELESAVIAMTKPCPSRGLAHQRS